MPTPPKLCLQPLEERALLSAWYYDSPDDQVVHGSDDHDLITLTRLDDDRVRVTVQSFLDPEWTQPTDDPATSYEAARWLVAAVNGGGGHDRVQVIDPIFGHALFFGTTLHQMQTVNVVTFNPDGSFTSRIEEYERSYARLDATESTPATLTDGAEMDDGAEIGVFFDSWIWIDDPVPVVPILPWEPWIEPWDPVPEPPADAWVDLAWIGPLGPTDELVSFDPELVIGEDGEVWPAVAWEPGSSWDVEPSDPGDLVDLWIELADGVPVDQSDGWAGEGEDWSDWFTGEDAEDWLMTDLVT